MVLTKHIDPEKLINELDEDDRRKDNIHLHQTRYAARNTNLNIPKYKMPEDSIDPNVAYRIVHDDLDLDGKVLQNCATFMTGWMDPQAEQLIKENLAKNFVDQDGFPSTQRVHERCISMLSHLWKIPRGSQAVGTVCGGSSEGIILGGLAMKWAWREKRKQQGLDHSKPNVVFGSNAHCCIEKFARYFDVESRIVPVTKEGNYVMHPDDCVKYVDENTIGVYSILGSTYTGHFEPVEQLAAALDKVQQEKGWDIPIHIDGASGGFVAPFAFPDLKWSFEVKRVVSINASGHKYGLVYPGLGWVIWRGKEHLHHDLIFEMDYLGVTERSFTLNFSRPATHIIAQYYNFIRLGINGYSDIINNCLFCADHLSRGIEKSEYFTVVSNVHVHPKDAKKYGKGLPLVAFHLSDSYKEENPDVFETDIAGLIRTKGWMIPSYNLPKGIHDQKVLRIVVKESYSVEVVDRILDSLIRSADVLRGSNIHLTQAFKSMELGEPDPTKVKDDGENDEVKPRKPKRSSTYSSYC